jgi:tetratricopeptide (TPR) repeat protein
LPARSDSARLATKANAPALKASAAKQAPPVFSCTCEIYKLEDQGKWRDAAALSLKTIGDPLYNQSHANIGYAWELAHYDLDKALGYAHAAVALRGPDLADAYNTRSYIYLHQGRVLEALADIDKAMRLRSDPYYLIRYAQCLEKVGRPDLARQRLREAKRQFGDWNGAVHRMSGVPEEEEHIMSLAGD